jgi:hypothetical protein
MLAHRQSLRNSPWSNRTYFDTVLDGGASLLCYAYQDPLLKTFSSNDLQHDTHDTNTVRATKDTWKGMDITVRAYRFDTSFNVKLLEKGLRGPGPWLDYTLERFRVSNHRFNQWETNDNYLSLTILHPT